MRVREKKGEDEKWSLEKWLKALNNWECRVKKSWMNWKDD